MASTSTTLTVRDPIPKIGGSTAGFIALIVCLVVIIVVSSLFIVYFLREECTMGRFTRRRRHRHERNTSSSAFIYDESSERRSRSWTKELAKFLHLQSATVDSSARGLSGAMPMRDERRWHRTGSDDIWDHTVPELMEAHNPLNVESRVSTASPRTSMSPLPDAHGHRASFYHNDSPASSGVRFDSPDSPQLLPGSSSILLPPKGDLPSPYSGLAATEMRRFLSQPSSNSPTLIYGSSSSLRSGSPMPRRTVSPVPLASESTSPVGSFIRTFEGGSKFLEAL